MRWFQGNIVEAVTQSKARNAVFVVFIEGKDDVSQRIASAIDDVEVSSKLEGQNFVSIHLESESQTFTQFSQIYRNPAVPSLYFIGRTGSPIKIVTEAIDSKALLEQIVLVENVHFGKSSSNEASSSQSSEANTPASQLPETSSSYEANSTRPSSSSAPLDERVERAKELLEEKRMKKQAQEEEEAIQKELRRRKEGQNVQEMRRLQNEQEMKQLKEERMKDKRIEQEARQRVLEQIAQDRAARNARNVTAAPSPASSAPAPAPAVSNSNEARLQFRLPDGSTHSHTFEAVATLGDVRQYIISNVNLPCQNFTLATVYPRHEFTPQDNSSTLRDLLLVPSSAILIVPAGGSAGTLQNSPGLFGFAQTMFMFMTYPLTRLFSFIRVFIFGAPPPTAGSSSGTSAGSTTSSNQNQQDRRPQRRSGGAYRRSGNSNVHRLHQSNSSSDDENNTWNGNSTQQM